jgi:hypothetical protein
MLLGNKTLNTATRDESDRVVHDAPYIERKPYVEDDIFVCAR